MTTPPPEPTGPTKRPTCERCGRPQLVCVCAQLPHLVTENTNVVLLQHPRESHKGIGTARLAHLSLPGSLLKAGLDFSDDAEVQQVVAAAPAYVLFPGAHAIALEDLPKDQRITLVVVDGTWWQAKKLIKLNPWLEQMPRVSFNPSAPSDYRIRRQPAAHCVSTIEALAEVLCQREPAGQAFQHLRDPFRAMVDHQVRFKEEVFSSRHRRRARPRDKRRPTLPKRLQSEWSRLVFVQGEANSWPARHPERPTPDLVHLLAVRADDGSTFETIVPPRQPLAPSTSRYVELSAEQLAQGEPLPTAQARWNNFLRPDDLVCVWGAYHMGLALGEGWRADSEILDLRNALSQFRKAKLSLVEEGLPLLDLTAAVTTAPGRAHRRLVALIQIAEKLRALAPAGPA